MHSNLQRDHRREVIQDFASGKTAVLTNYRILATGYDCPAVSDVALLSRVGSAVQFEQMVGRACRGPKTGGAASATVWDLDDHLQLHGLPESYFRFNNFDWE